MIKRHEPIYCESVKKDVHLIEKIRYIPDGNSKYPAGSRTISKDCTERTNCKNYASCKYLK